MIQSKQDYKYYLEADRIALEKEKPRTLTDKIIRNFIVIDYVWRFEKILRKVEYLQNCHPGIIGKIRLALAWRQFHHLRILLGFHIFPNNFGPGLSISHPGPIIVNIAARIGANCRIHPCTVIGTQAGYDDQAAKIGDNIYIGPGVKIFGQIEIADNIAIGANSVVNKSFTEPGITIAGVPAKKVSDKGSEGFLVKATEILKRSDKL